MRSGKGLTSPSRPTPNGTCSPSPALSCVTAPAVLGGEDVPGLVDDIDELERSVDSAGRAVLDGGAPAADGTEEAARISFHTRLVAVAAISCATDALVATRQATPAIVSAELSRWRGGLVRR